MGFEKSVFIKRAIFYFTQTKHLRFLPFFYEDFDVAFLLWNSLTVIWLILACKEIGK